MTPLPSLTLASGTTRVEVVPGRGALVTTMEVDGEPVLSLDPATLADRTRSVRGGIPLLFPIAGRLEGDGYEVEGRRYALKQHGFARDLAWAPHPEGPSRLRLTLDASADTLERFPFAFSAEVGLAVAPRRLQLDFTLRNPDARRPLPLHFGLHPYFHVPQGEKARARVETDARRAWDNRARAHVPFTGLPLEADEVDLHLLDHSAPGTTLHRGEGRAPLRLTWSPAFRTLVVWTLAGKDFVCVEPWTAPAGALQTGAGLQHVPPGASTTLSFSVEAL